MTPKKEAPKKAPPVVTKKVYQAPQIVHETVLETRAGSPIKPVFMDDPGMNSAPINPWDPEYTE